MNFGNCDQSRNRFGRKYGNMQESATAEGDAAACNRFTNPQGQIVKVTQSFNGSQNGYKFSAGMVGTININTGDCNTAIILNDTDNPAGFIFLTTITITCVCGAVIVPGNGTQNIGDLISSSNYRRVLSYQFLSGEKLLFESEVDLLSLSARTRVSGNYPAYLDGEITKDPLITMAEPAIMKMVNAPGDSGVSYSGRMKMLMNGKIVPIEVNAEYLFKGGRLKQDQIITFENASTLYDISNGVISKYVKAGNSPRVF